MDSAPIQSTRGLMPRQQTRLAGAKSPQSPSMGLHIIRGFTCFEIYSARTSRTPEF